MRVMQDEIFGPVACLIPFRDEAHAIELANDIAYGLSSYVWTENIGKAHRVAAAVEAGMCFVNSQNVRDLRQPFGGLSIESLQKGFTGRGRAGAQAREARSLDEVCAWRMRACSTSGSSALCCEAARLTSSSYKGMDRSKRLSSW